MDQRHIRDGNKRRRNATSYRSSRVQNNSKVIDIQTIRRKKSNTPQKGTSRSNKGLVNIIANKFNSGGVAFYKRIGIMASVAIMSVLTIWIVYAIATNKNAYEVFIADKSVGFIEKDKNITSDALTETVTNQLVTDVGANVQVLEKLTLTLVHASKKDIKTIANMIPTIRKNLSYKIEATALSVDGEQIAILKNPMEVEEVLQRVISQFVPEDKNIVDPGFMEEITQKSIYVSTDEIATADKAYTLLTQSAESERIYTVLPNDSLWSIASDAGMSVEELLSLNPHMNANSVLKIGDEIKLVLPKPFLSVITKEEVTRLETIKKSVIYQDNPERKKNYQKSIQQGKDGQKEIVEYIIRTNGFETGMEPVSEKVVIDPVEEIIERGTQP